ncbi:hypothetical protein QEN19_001846 [Hanseniaspora menglaensis]
MSDSNHKNDLSSEQTDVQNLDVVIQDQPYSHISNGQKSNEIVTEEEPTEAAIADEEQAKGETKEKVIEDTEEKAKKDTEEQAKEDDEEQATEETEEKAREDTEIVEDEESTAEVNDDKLEKDIADDIVAQEANEKAGKNGNVEEEEEEDNNVSVIHNPYNNSDTTSFAQADKVSNVLEELEEVGDLEEEEYSEQNQLPITSEPVYKFEEDATPEEISKSKNIKSTLAFLKKSFEEFLESKEFKNLTSVSSSTKKALSDAIENINKILDSPPNAIASLNSIVIFEALRSCCRCKINNGKVMALDGLSKLFAFQLLDERALVNPPDTLSVNVDSVNGSSNITPPPKLKLMDAAIDTITDCFEGEVTNQNVELQIIRCLTSLILMEDSLNICHGQSLLKAIRTIYNIFIFSLNSSTQTIAQATLIQVVQKVFQRVRDFTDSKNIKADTLDDLQNASDSITEEQLCIKDAFLVFRSMAKISVKNIEDSLDMRSHAVRSKLLSLHMLHSILRDQVSLFLNPSVKLYSNGDKSLIDSIRQYLCLAISRNATSPIAPVFEITLEILWLLVANLKFYFKREIPVFFAEIYLPIAELKTSTNHQKKYFLQFLSKISSDPKIIIEFYLNYDCDEKYPNLTEIIVDFLSSNTLNKTEQVTDLDKKQYIDSLKTNISTYDLSQLPLLSISNLAGGSVSNATGLSDSSSTSIQIFSSSSGNSTKQLSNSSFPILYHLKLDSLRCIILILRSLSTWANLNTNVSSSSNLAIKLSRKASISSTSNTNLSEENENSNSVIADLSRSGSDIKYAEEDNEVQQFEVSKLRKTMLSKLLSVFNKKPKRAIPDLLAQGFIEDTTPTSIAKFLLTTEGLNLSTVGDYLGEGTEENIAIMHEFVDQLDFKSLSFTDALRNFLQKFRLPGEGQKIDRFMLKFAERFVEQNPNVFAKADTAYVLAYAVIMLNTDLHSPQIKKRMTLDEFIDLTGGVNEPKDLTKEYITGLYDEIQNNEIKLLSEQHEAALAANGGGNVTNANNNTAFNFFNMRDLNREAYMQVSKEITSKTETVVKNLAIGASSTEDIQFYFATSPEHSNLVFQTLWMSFLASFTTPFNENEDEYPVSLCLEGLQHGIRISSYFGNEMARSSFVGALIQFTNLTNVAELKIKNIVAIYKLLEVVLQIGDFLKDSWKDILFVVSQVERLQLIAKGIDVNSVPDVSSSRLKNVNSRVSRESTRSTDILKLENESGSETASFFGLWQTKKPNPIEQAQDKHSKQSLKSEISQMLVSSDISLYIDKIFTGSADLSAIAVIDFIKALTEVSVKEIESSQDSAQPRIFALQKMVDVCYYNMERIRVEWKPMWEVMGEAFITIASNKNKNLAVVFFAIDSLRQLSMRFLNLNELQGFEFQHDFLRPYKFIIQNSSSNYEIQEMCLECFNQFIVAKGQLLKSGWKPIFESLQYLASTTIMENVSTRVLNIANVVLKSNVLLDVVFKQTNTSSEKGEVFLQLMYVFRNICKNSRFPRNALKSLDSLKKFRKYLFKDIKNAKTTETKLTEDEFNRKWYPLLFSYHDIIMSSKDMEVRSAALTELFECLVGYGSVFTVEIWSKICKLLLFPIFAVLSMHWNIDQFSSHEELNVWLSTTLIQALRNSIALFTHFFDMLQSLLPGFLDLLVSCICQENDTIARIGRSCLQQLIIENSIKFTEDHWKLIIDNFENLFELTTANELFESDPLKKGRRKSLLAQKQPKIELDEVDAKFEDVANDNKQTIDFSNAKNERVENGETLKATTTSAATEVKKSGFKKQDMISKKLSLKNTIVVKCVLQLMVIELLSELFDDEKFRNNQNLKIEQLVRVTGMLERSYTFARDFNDDFGLRTRLVEAQVVDKIPNLLKQESSSAAVLIAVLFKLYFQTEDDKKNNAKLMSKLMEFCVDIIQRYVSFDENKMEKNIITMRPVVIEILQGIYEFDDEDFKDNSSDLYHLVLQILEKNMSYVPLRMAVKQFFDKVGELYFL